MWRARQTLFYYSYSIELRVGQNSNNVVLMGYRLCQIYNLVWKIDYLDFKSTADRNLQSLKIRQTRQD